MGNSPSKKTAPARLAQVIREINGHNSPTSTRTEEDLLNGLRKSAREGNLVLVLGAGVSTSSGLPDWSTLLQKILLDLQPFTKNPGEETLQKIFEEIFRPSPLVTARSLENHFHQQSRHSEIPFLNALRAALYANYNPAAATPLLDAITALAASASYPISAIITYNYDNLLEQKLPDAGRKTFRTVVQGELSTSPEVLPIYHVHGYLPQQGRLSSRNHVVLSERFYHNRYSQPYDWSNLTQVTAYSQKRCLFIGTSLRDPNQRRLLDMARGKSHPSHLPPHVIIRRRNNPVNLLAKLQSYQQAGIIPCLPTTPEDTTRIVIRLSQMIEKFEEEDSKSLNINTLWVDSHDDFAKILRRIPAR